MNDEPEILESPINRLEAAAEPSIPAKQLQDAMEWVLQPEVPAKIRNSFFATMWMLQVNAFREVEDRHLADETYKDNLSDHRRVLSTLITRGEQVVFAVGREGMISGPNAKLNNYSLDDLQATLNSLHVTFRGEYGPHNSHKTNELISQIFNES
jgi:hypothetical protein